MSTDLGRIASQYYLRFDTVVQFKSGERAKVQPSMTDDLILFLIALASEFAELKVRN